MIGIHLKTACLIAFRGWGGGGGDGVGDFPYIFSSSGKERPHKSGKHLYPYVKKSVKTQHGRIQLILQFGLQLDIIS